MTNTTTVTLPSGETLTGDQALVYAWNAILAQEEMWDKAAESPVVWEDSAFDMTGELKGCREVVTHTSECRCRRELNTFTMQHEVIECVRCREADNTVTWGTRGEGMTDTTEMSDDSINPDTEWTLHDPYGVGPSRYHRSVWEESTTARIGRWEHLKDAHLEEMDYIDRQIAKPVYGSNPTFAAMKDAKVERETRYAKVMNWIDSAPTPQLLQRRFGYAKKQRNLHLAKSLGFSEVPKGKWPGVEWDKNLGMVRKYEKDGHTVTRLVQMWDCVWTKEQATTIDSKIAQVVAKRLGK